MDNYTEEERIAFRSQAIEDVLFNDREPTGWVYFISDVKGTVYLGLTDFSSAIAMITPKTIRYKSSTVYKDIFDRFAKQTGRKVFRIEQFRCRRGLTSINFRNFKTASGISKVVMPRYTITWNPEGVNRLVQN